MVRSESQGSFWLQHEAEMVNEPHQMPVLSYDSDFPRRECDTTINPPVSPLQRLMDPQRTASELTFQFKDRYAIFSFRSSAETLRERYAIFSFSSSAETLRERYATVIQKTSTASSELFEPPSWCSLQTGVQNPVVGSRYLRSDMKDIHKVACSVIYRTWNFCLGRVLILDDIDRTVGYETSVENDDEIKARSLYQCKLGRVHMLNTDRSVADETSVVNDSELFCARTRNLYQCKLDRVHMLDINRTAEEMPVVNDRELCARSISNLYQCKLGRVKDDETVFAVSDSELVDIQLSDCSWTALMFRLPILLALISNSIATLFNSTLMFNSTLLTAVISLELFFRETMHSLLSARTVPRCSENLYQCMASVFNLCRKIVCSRQTSVLQKSLKFHILESSVVEKIEGNHITLTIERSVFLPEEHPRSSTVKEHRQHLLKVCSVWYKYLRIVLLSLLLSSSCLLLLLTLAKLRLVFKLWLGELKSHDVVYLLVVALLLVAWIQVIPAASLTRGIHEPVKLSSSKTITIIIMTLSCYVNLTDSAPLHLPNLLIRGTAGGNGTYMVPLQGSPNTGYCAKITIGLKPYPQEFCVLVDTGSANLAVAGVPHPDINSWFDPQQSYNYTSLGQTVSVSYTAGDWTGTLSKDYIAIKGPSSTWHHSIEAFFVLITNSQHFFINDADWVGILGMAYSSLAKPDSSVVTFWDALRRATRMRDMFSLQFCPPLDIPLLDITEPRGGTMVLGGLNNTLYRGPIFFTDIVEQRFYSVLVSNLTIGNTSISLDCKEFNNDQSIVDSGTTDIFFPEKVFTEVKNTFIAHFKNGRPLPVPENFWVGGTKLAWPADDKSTIYGAFPSLYLGFATAGDASQEFSLVVTPQIYLRQIEGTSSEQHDTNCYPECDFFTFGIKQRERGTVIGGNVLLGFLAHFDRETQRIGFAKSTCQYQNPHDGVPEIVGPYPRIPKDCQCSDCKPGLPYWEIVSYTCGSIVCPLAIISIICAFCGRRCRKQEPREEEVGCWKRIAKCCRTCFHCCFSWKRKSVSRPIPEDSERLLDRESGLREASAPIVDESEHEASEEKVGYLERAVRFCNSCFCCCQCFWKKRSFSLPIPESCEEDDQVNRDVVSTCSLGAVEAELVGTARGSKEEREEKEKVAERERMAGRERMAEGESEVTVEGSKHISAMEETDSNLDTSQNLGDSGPVSAHSEVVPLLQPETTENSSKLALSKHESLSTGKQQSKKVRSKKGRLEEERQRKVSEKDIAGDQLPNNISHKSNTWPLVTESIAEESNDVPSNSRKSSAIHNTSKCRTVVEQNEAVDHAYLVDGSEGHNVEVSMHKKSEINITCDPQTKFLLSSRKIEIDVKDISVQKVQKQCSSESGYCSRQTSRQDSQQLGAEDSWHRVSSTDQTCLVNRQKSSDSALACDFEEN